MNTSSQLAAMRPYLDPWAKIDFLGLVSLIFGDKAQGFLSLQSAFFSSMHLANMPFAFPFFMENTQQLPPWVHVLHKPHLYKMKMRMKRKAPKYSWLKLWCSSLISLLLTDHIVKSCIPFCVLSCNHFLHVLRSIRKQVWKCSHNTSLVNSLTPTN